MSCAACMDRAFASLQFICLAASDPRDKATSSKYALCMSSGDEHTPASATASAPDPFVWPPRRPAPPTSPAAPPSPSPASASQPASASRTQISPWLQSLIDIERHWLGLVSPPWNIRAAEAAWQADAHDDYCWRCGVTVGDFEVTPPESQEPGCTTCRGKRLAWERTIRVGEYRGLLRKAIQETKFRASHALGLALGRELGHQVKAQMSWQRVSSESLLIVPAPMSTLRRFRSGIDHAGAIARGVAEVAGGRIIRPLHRLHGPSQLEVPPSQRARNAARAIEPRQSRLPLPSIARPAWHRLLSSPPPQGWIFLVVDDVKTTGATMSAACKALRVAAASTENPIKTRSGPSVDGSGKTKSRSASRIWSGVVGVTPDLAGAKVQGDIPEDSLDLDL